MQGAEHDPRDYGWNWYLPHVYRCIGGSGEGPPAYGAAWGVNARPDPGVVLKLQYMTAIFPSAGNEYYLVHDPLRLFEAQVAWVF